MTEHPRLIVREIEAEAIPGGKAMALCWEDGTPVGHQTGCDVSFDVGDYGALTVRMHIDGELVGLGNAVQVGAG